MTILLHSGSAHSFFPPGLSTFRSHFLFFYYCFTCTHTHRRIIQIQHVDLYDAYLPLSLIETLLSNGIRTPRYALICQGLRFTHNTTIKSKHLHGSSAPRTYSIICIGSESCLGSNVGFSRLPCFVAIRSTISAKAAQEELLQLCPSSSRRASQ